MDNTQIIDNIEAIIERAEPKRSLARDPVNAPMIHHLGDALGDFNPIYSDPEAAKKAGYDDVVAPPASLQVWNMVNPGEEKQPEGDIDRAYEFVTSAGFSNVVAVNCEQDYDRYLQPGDLLTCEESIEQVTGPKQTALGEGFFITTLTSYYDQHGHRVGRMRFRTLWYRIDDAGVHDG